MTPAQAFLQFADENQVVLNEFFEKYLQFQESVKQWKDHAYPVYSMAEEAMEFQVATRMTKDRFRGDGKEADLTLVRKELGDIFFFWMANNELFVSSPLAVVRENVLKIADRQERGVIKGDGDKR